MESFDEDAVIVKKDVWIDIQRKLIDIEYLKSNRLIKVEVECTYNSNSRYSFNIGSIEIRNRDKIAPECMEEFKKRINSLIKWYENSNNSKCNIQELNEELKQIKSTRYYKWFHKKNK